MALPHNYEVRLHRLPRVLQRGLRMCAIKHGMTVEQFAVLAVQEAVNKELADIAGTSWWTAIDTDSGHMKPRRRGQRGHQTGFPAIAPTDEKQG